jgi:hypothetical protein
MSQIPERRPRADALLIHVQEELVIGADMHQKMRGCLRQLQDFAEMEHEGIALRRVRTRDPLSTPRLVEKVGCDLSDEGPTVQQQHQDCRNEYSTTESHSALQ